MEYRVNKKTGDKISVIGLGTGYICDASEREAVEALRLAYEGGINFADLATAGAKTFVSSGQAFSEVGRSMPYHLHLGAHY